MRLLNAFSGSALALAAILASSSALAEQSVSDGRYEIHYNAFNSSLSRRK